MTSFLRYHIASHTEICNNIMIKSTKLERMAIEARLRDALAIKGNSDIEATLNTIIDYNNVEKIFLKLHQQYENLFICEYHNANTFDGQRRGHGSKYDLERDRVEFIRSFNELVEIFSNVVEVQRQKRETDAIIDDESHGTATIVRGGKKHGVHITKPFITAKKAPVYSPISPDSIKPNIICIGCGKRIAHSHIYPHCDSCF